MKYIRSCESCRYWDADELVGISVIDHDIRNPYKDGKCWRIIGAGVCHREWGIVDSVLKPEGREMLSGYIEPNSNQDCSGYRHQLLKKPTEWFLDLNFGGKVFLVLSVVFLAVMIFGSWIVGKG